MAYDAMTGTIDFAEALVCLKRGGKVRRLSWFVGIYVVLAADKFVAVNSMIDKEGSWVPDADDVLAMDWEETV